MSSSKKELIGPAEDKIRTLLSQSGDPLEAIRAIQKDYGLDLNGIENMYPLLDLCGYSRLEIHRACLNALNQAAVERIENPSFKLENFYDLFQKTFPYIHIPLMQPIPMALLKKFEKHIDNDVIEKIKSDLNVFENCPLNIKKRIWKQDEVFFQQSMILLLNEYHHDEVLQNLALNLRPDNYQEILKERRSHPIVLRIIQAINQDPQIYVMFMKLIRVVFQSTPYPSLCSLHVDICMVINDTNGEASDVLNEIDDCHGLIWSLDKCIRKQSIDDESIQEIQQCFDDVRNGSVIYANYSMVLMDPIISNFLAYNIVRWLRMDVDQLEDEERPNLRELIDYNGKLLNLAEHAPEAVANDAKIPKFNKDLKDYFWSDISKLMIEEQTHQTNEGILKRVLGLLKESEIARRVFVQYSLDRLIEGDIYSLSKALPLILQSASQEFFEEEKSFIYLSCIKSMMDILMKRYLFDCIMDLRWRQVVVEGFLLKVISLNTKLHEHMVRFLAEYYTDPKNLSKLGPPVALIAEWADITVRVGLKDEKSFKTLKDLYAYLLTRSNSVLNGEFRITPPSVIQFCSS